MFMQYRRVMREGGDSRYHGGGSGEASEGHSRSDFGSGKATTATRIQKALRERGRVRVGEHRQGRIRKMQGTLVCWDRDR